MKFQNEAKVQRASNYRPPKKITIRNLEGRYGNLRLPTWYQNEAATTPNIYIFFGFYFIVAEERSLQDQLSESRTKNSQLEKRIEELARHSEVIAQEINTLRGDNEFLAGVNQEFGRENDELRKKNKELENRNTELEKKIGRYEKYRLPESLRTSDSGSQSKRRKIKGENPVDKEVKSDPDDASPIDERKARVRTLFLLILFIILKLTLVYS